MKSTIQYNHKQIERKWQKKWEEAKVYSPELSSAQNKFYNLMMFPYPSAEGMHVGNAFTFIGADVYGRFQRMQGKNVLEPIGLDGFGIHSENYAIKIGKHPKEHAKDSEANFYRQLHEIGNSYDWQRTLETYDPDYYRWTQWLFIQMIKAGLAYKAGAMVNWCPSCKTVLSDEQVISGECERCGSKVERREMSSWYFRITKYADKLLENIEKIDWPEKIKHAQRLWIGRSKGTIITFKLLDSDREIEVFTTKPETIKGVTFMALSPEKAKEFIDEIPESQQSVVEDYINKSLNRTEQERKSETKDKTGVDTGLIAINSVNGDKLPVWVADYVLSGVGTGCLMGVPEGDERDKEFAKKFGLRIIKYEPFVGELGKQEVRYHLRDWLISRQRYWGPPIPMVNCAKCGYQPVPEADLPVLLPDIKDFKPKGDGTSPLSNAPESWKKVACPNCGGEAERELDVSDTFLDSAWYFLAYPNLGTPEWKGTKSPFNKKVTQDWLPVDVYIGGAEHAVLHLLYARFVTMALHDLGYLSFEEPFPYLYGHGLIIKDGAKMSKSKGNVVVPDDYIEKYGADTLRMYLQFLGPYDQGGDFRDTGIEGMNRFIRRLWEVFNKVESADKENEKLTVRMHQTIAKVSQDISKFHYNTAISAIMEYVNAIREENNYSPKYLKTLALLIAPFAPHMAEEVWNRVLGEKFSIHTTPWPQFEPEKLEVKEVTVVIQVDGRVRSQLIAPSAEAKSKKTIETKAIKDPKVAKWLKGEYTSIFVPGKLINFATGK